MIAGAARAEASGGGISASGGIGTGAAATGAGSGGRGASRPVARTPSSAGARCKLGDCGGDVATLNWILKAKDYGSPALVDEFEDATEVAVEDFQARRRSAPPTGSSTPRPRRRWSTRCRPSSRPGTGPASSATRPPAGRRSPGARSGVAHKTLPCGSKVVVRYRGRFVRTTVIDRGPVRQRRQVGPDPGDRAGARLRVHGRGPGREARRAASGQRRVSGR